MTVSSAPIAKPNKFSLRPGLTWWIDTFLCVAVGLFSYRYLFGTRLRFEIIDANALKLPWLGIHVAGAATAILIGPFQFLTAVRRRWPGYHRWLGRIYVAGCLLGAVSGMVLAFGSAAGPVATAGFGLLSIAWLVTTGQAWRTALRRSFSEHRVWMLRSFALTNAAVTLRLYLAVLPVLPIPFLDAYRAISFLCWVPNLTAAEIYLRWPKASHQQKSKELHS